eukprot:TRINITY_DN8744_c1_g2_i1.p1 TRINITY_DN8744_c1_g2~~TRINITY_DN8744_c1_g2_i1.p1  ORF type:complete len:513 (+),score=95.91 TRINITY_DN8744_c1_g2_i1:189-1541(+)
MKSYFASAPAHKVRFLYLMAPMTFSPPAAIRYWAAHYWRTTHWGVLGSFAHETAALQKWWNISEAPALAIFKDPLMDGPTVYTGPFTSSRVHEIISQHNSFLIPQIRASSVGSIGCDVTGFPKAGRSSAKQTWYCVVAAGMPAPALSRTRQMLLRIQTKLQLRASTPALAESPAGNDCKASEEDGEGAEVEGGNGGGLALDKAWREQRLTLAWLDGPTQPKFCGYVLGLEAALYCNKKQDGSQVGLGIILLQRPEAQPGATPKAIANNYVTTFKGDITNQTEVEEWIDASVAAGDVHDWPDNHMKAPLLIEEDVVSTYSRVSEFLAIRAERMAQKAQALAPGLTERFASATGLPIDDLPTSMPKRGSPIMNALAIGILFIWLWRVSNRFLRPSRTVAPGDANASPAVETAAGGDGAASVDVSADAAPLSTETRPAAPAEREGSSEPSTEG